MTIATWNLERLKYNREVVEIISILENLNADILVLTEYDEKVDLKRCPFQIATKNLALLHSENYKQSNFKFLKITNH